MNQSIAITCPQANTDFITNMLMVVKMLLVVPFGVLTSSLVLYMTHSLNLSDFTAISVTACFLGTTGLLRIAAGYIADCYLSHRYMLLLSSLFMLAGCLLTAVPQLIYWGIACIALGSAFTIAVNCLLTNLFQQDDIKRESVFLRNYSMMNIGYIISFAIGGYYELHHQYQLLFMVSSGFSFLSLLMILSGWRILSLQTSFYSGKHYNNAISILLILIMYICIYELLNIASISKQYFQILSSIVAICIIVYSIKKVSNKQQNNFFTYLIFLFPVLIFSTIQNLTPMVLTLFMERNVDRYYFGQFIPPQWIQLFGNAVIIVGGPLLCYLFGRLRKLGIKINTTLQFSAALMLIGTSLLIITTGIWLTDINGLVNFNWIMVSNLLQGFAELLIAPIGFSMIAKIAPSCSRGTMMGIWLLLLSMGAIFSGMISNMISDVSSSCFFLGSFSILVGLVIFLFRSNQI